MKLCGFDIGLDRPFFLIAGPCVLEGEQMAVDIASAMKETTDELGIPYLFKASYDKANRTSAHSFRGPGMDEGLRILAAVREKVGVPVLTDVHTEAEVPVVASVVDMLQTPSDGFHPRLRSFWQARQHQEGPVPCTGRHAQRRREGP